MKQKIGIIGVGMVGAPLAKYFKEMAGYRRGKNLFLFDTDPAKKYSDDVNRADIIFVCVPTPRSARGAIDLSHMHAAVAGIKLPKIVVIKSTVVPGSTEYFQKKFPKHAFLFNPEFLTERNAWENTCHPDRQLVGWTCPTGSRQNNRVGLASGRARKNKSKSRRVAGRVLALLPKARVSAPSPKLNVTATEAEIIKYAANVFLARKVTFANAIFDLASRHGADYERIRMGLGSDARIGYSHLDVHHGGYRGYGGYCFIKDTDALVAHAAEQGLEHIAELIGADVAFNTRVLASQGLTPEDVAMHDKKVKIKK